jgi:hypothetical protein
MAANIPQLLKDAGFKKAGCPCNNSLKYTKGTLTIKRVGGMWRVNGATYNNTDFIDLIPTL